jgi:GNAT superfamily N-acetyltransferase
VAIVVAAANEADLPELADVAARTFPLACPPSVTAENIAAFIDENLSQARFRDYLADPDRAVLAARDDGRIVGYVMLIRGVPDDDDVQKAVTLRPAVELSKMYVLPDCHGAGVSGALMTAALTEATDRFYTKHGFSINGTKTFRLGAGIENDYVMVRPV